MQGSILSVTFFSRLRVWTVCIEWTLTFCKPENTNLMKMKLCILGACILYISLPLGKWTYLGPSLVFYTFFPWHDFDVTPKNYIACHTHKCFRPFCAPPFDRSTEKKRPSCSVVILYWLTGSLLNNVHTLCFDCDAVMRITVYSRGVPLGHGMFGNCKSMCICNYDSVPWNSMYILYKVMSCATTATIISNCVNLWSAIHASRISFSSVTNITAGPVHLKHPFQYPRAKMPWKITRSLTSCLTGRKSWHLCLVLR